MPNRLLCRISIIAVTFGQNVVMFFFFFFLLCGVIRRVRYCYLQPHYSSDKCRISCYATFRFNCSHIWSKNTVLLLFPADHKQSLKQSN